MASTPPAQIRTEARTPPTPLHGSAYHSSSTPRYSFRTSTKRTPDSASASFTRSPRSAKSPASPRASDIHFHSPQATPKKQRTARHHPPARPISPTSPDANTNDSLQSRRKPTHLSATTVLAEGMLPTPIKTPQKKASSKSTITGRALFQDNASTMPFPSPRKQAKKRHNGFSLESFSENATNGESVQIFIDSRDKVPEVDTSVENPFYQVPTKANEAKKRTAPSKIEPTASGTKRRKINTEESDKQKRALDPQVKEAIEQDEGMVYVFRGKKVYRRFDDAGEEEEVIDPEELGLLENETGGTEGVRKLKTLTRKAIMPRKLFQSNTPPQVESHVDEEAETEIEDELGDGQNGVNDASPSRATRSMTKLADSPIGAGSKRKRTSPFDKWPRVKGGSSSSIGRGESVPVTKGRKRTAAEALDT